MVKTYEELREKARKGVLEILADENKWNFFLDVIKIKQGAGLVEAINNIRKSEEKEKDHLLLEYFYTNFLLEHVCDSCEYNPHWRRGVRKFAEKKMFDCTWTKTEGDVLAEQTAREEGLGGASYKFNDPAWKAEYEKLVKIILEQHTDRTKAPLWLDEKRNYCPHHYTDLSKP